MKLEVGMYVRTKTGIEQIYKIDNNKTKYKYLFKLKKQDGDGCIDCGVLSSEDILKASHSLLGDDKEDGIIEVGDYVNGSRVELITDYNEKYLGYKIGSCYLRLGTFEIKSIVTKEQFAAMQYEVKKD